MNKHFPLIVLLTTATILSYGQANTSLSNLTSPTSVNVNLIPINNNSRNLGSTSKSWKTLYLGTSLYLNDTLFLHSTGSRNAFVGLQAGNSITTGSYNTAGGYKSFYSNTTGGQNTAYGATSLYSNINGYCNVALGQASLYLNAGGFFNSGLGFETLFYNTSGSRNTASGSYAMFQNTTGSSNTASGAYALANNTTGSYNTAIGDSALFYNAANYNTASGYQSLYSNGSGEQNTTAGCFSLYANSNGGYNVINGYKAGRFNTSGSNNVFIGWQAGFHNTEGFNNVYLGSNADGAAGISNAVAIGANVVATLKNTIILGTTQNVGIGTTNPTYRLSVNGTIQAKELRVETGWSDYVFEKDYKLRSLESVAKYIEQNKHLPGIPSAKEIQDNGLAVGEVQTKMMEKIEELTLYVIELKKEIDAMKNNQSERK